MAGLFTGLVAAESTGQNLVATAESTRQHFVAATESAGQNLITAPESTRQYFVAAAEEVTQAEATCFSIDGNVRHF
ncbi:hypothetical protein Cenrod_2677 [Candidatus Symbiobacter mobilis CR]|uniref:Uncharacterized protein n=1 Tax=Candidatus Symbiobacter mobilis CR TaxID=946483 RepID=U5NBC5_9BURK|nr:hypothetical protein Cenrod_2677 [Candidatus Symbiobacter mobilis CR]